MHGTVGLVHFWVQKSVYYAPTLLGTQPLRRLVLSYVPSGCKVQNCLMIKLSKLFSRYVIGQSDYGHGSTLRLCKTCASA